MLRNKNTGEIINGCFVVCEYRDGARFSVDDKPVFDSLGELNEEWEDYKPKINSRFRLVKDLPTFKAGQEFYLSPKGNLILNDGKFGICAYARQTLEKFPNILEEWFEPIGDEEEE